VGEGFFSRPPDKKGWTGTFQHSPTKKTKGKRENAVYGSGRKGKKSDQCSTGAPKRKRGRKWATTPPEYRKERGKRNAGEALKLWEGEEKEVKGPFKPSLPRKKWD